MRQRRKGLGIQTGWMAHDAGIDQGTLLNQLQRFISNENFNSYKLAAQDICLLLLIHATTALWVVQVKSF